jgi:hypothetical protein
MPVEVRELVITTVPESSPSTPPANQQQKHNADPRVILEMFAERKLRQKAD